MLFRLTTSNASPSFFYPLNMLKAIFISIVLLIVTSHPVAAQNTNLSTDDQAFLALRDAANKEDARNADALAAQLQSYPLPSYVAYYQLKAHLRSAKKEEITAFLSRFKGSAIADRLRNDWLLLLGNAADWANFDENYPLFALDDDNQLKCYALLSSLKKGKNVAAEARNLLTSARIYGAGCYALFDSLEQTGQFSQDDTWNQIRWASESGQGAAGVKLAQLASLNNAAKAIATNANKNIEKTLSQPIGSSVEAHQVALILVGRLAKDDVSRAVTALNKFKSALSAQELALAWGQIAYPASIKLLPEALDYWKKTSSANLSNDAQQWRARIALRNSDWRFLSASIEAMPAELQADPTWVYWQGRAALANGNADKAQKLFASISDQYHFYGQLAREERGQQITIPTRSLPNPADVSAMGANQGFIDAIKFYALDLRFEASREWNWQLRGMSDKQLLAAAEFARQNELLDRMVNTSDRTQALFDFTQRYPMPHSDIMQPATSKLGLDMAWVYGLIRQESRFIKAARSRVGASGLMQVMPSTAKYVAKKLNIDNYRHNTLNDLDTNVMLGTNYLNMVVSNLDGSQTLASAGYNAGPGRAKAWRASLPNMVEGAIFAETIPFTETRDYVKNVLSNATYYAALLQQKPQSLKARLGSIAPISTDQTSGSSDPDPSK